MSKYTPEEIKSCMERRVGLYPSELTQDALREAECLEQVMALPKGFDDRVRYFANLVVQMVGSSKCDDRLRSRISALAQSMSYLANSSSWTDGKLHDFDERELKRKLQHFV